MNSKLRLPNFLVIGAMKSGTSSICSDLNRHPDVFFPRTKEPNCLVRILRGDNLSLSDYSWYYKGQEEKILGDGSTGNSKFPYRSSTAELAAKLLPTSTKILYVIKDPIDRIERHIAHNLAAGELSSAKNAIFSDPQYVCLSAYQMQLSFWYNSFPSRSILTIDFSNYLNDRNSTIKRICSHLGIQSDPLLDLPPIFANSSSERRVPRSRFLNDFFSLSSARRLRERLPFGLRRIASKALMKNAPSVDISLSPLEREYCASMLSQLNGLVAPSSEQVHRIFHEFIKNAGQKDGMFPK